MAQSPDWDQGGRFKQSTRVSLGPSVGLVDLPGAVVTVTSAGAISIPLGTNLVTVNVNGAVTINLPSSKPSLAGAMSQPYTFAVVPLVVCDIGGHAAAFPVTINPAAGELIDGLARWRSLRTTPPLCFDQSPVGVGR